MSEALLPSNPRILAFYTLIIVALSHTQLPLFSLPFGLHSLVVVLALTFPRFLHKIPEMNDTSVFLYYMISRKIEVIWFYFSLRASIFVFSLFTRTPPSPDFKHYTLYEVLLTTSVIYLQTYSALSRSWSPAEPLHMLPLNVLNTSLFFFSVLFSFRSVFFFLGLVMAFVLLLSLHFIKFESPVLFFPRVFSLIFLQNYHLFLYLLFTTLLGVALIFKWGLNHHQSLTVRRKYFHILGAFLLLPPLLINPAFTSLAINTALFFFIILEISRRLLSSRFSVLRSLDAYLKLFACEEEKQANFNFSPIYLLAGIALPQILDTHALTKPIFLSLGIIFLGFGDTAAAVVGSKYGKIKVYHSKTLEGCLAGFLAMLLSLALIFVVLAQFSTIPIASLKSELLPGLGAIAAGSVSELYLRNDNLTVPPVMVVFYSGVSALIQ